MGSRRPLREIVLWCGGLVALVGISVLGFRAGHDGAPIRATPTTPTAPSEPGVGNVSSQYRLRVDALEAQLETDPASPAALLELGRLRLAAHDATGAAVLFERLVEGSPRDADAWLELGQSYSALKQWDLAEGAMHEVMKIRPGDESARYNLGAISANQGRHPDAERWWTPLMEDGVDPDLRTMARDGLAALAQRGGAL